ncbi:hypothetical protein [Mesorhizobium sp.]|uniref:hypothetical protein n=1 Tax=Mesorhizobium sp. TaxID=1871066 RepID=UPI000FE9143F|nr:hypothetical protein [Mesorhizobium sp.]RWP04063.1 MAG: hypothetical protein EOQ97_24400 [Mesorhizobium sp.]
MTASPMGPPAPPPPAIAPKRRNQVMAAIGGLVDEGRAEWNHTATGEIELRLLSGEVFVLSEMSVTRVA